MCDSKQLHKATEDEEEVKWKTHQKKHEPSGEIPDEDLNVLLHVS